MAVDPLSRLTVLLSADEFKRFEVYCSKLGFKKSTLVARLIREHLEGHDAQRQQRFKESRSKR